MAYMLQTWLGTGACPPRVGEAMAMVADTALFIGRGRNKKAATTDAALQVRVWPLLHPIRSAPAPSGPLTGCYVTWGCRDA
jgi:hypothetical protein